MAAPALTTTFTPPPSCLGNTYTSFGGAVWEKDIDIASAECYPSSYHSIFSLNIPYSPGICPESYTVASSSAPYSGDDAQTAALCCPNGFINAVGGGLGCSSVVAGTTTLAAPGGDTVVSNVQLAVHGVYIVTQQAAIAGSVSTATATATSGAVSSSLSALPSPTSQSPTPSNTTPSSATTSSTTTSSPFSSTSEPSSMLDTSSSPTRSRSAPWSITTSSSTDIVPAAVLTGSTSSTSTPTPTPNLSPGAKAGIGVGVSAAVLALLGLILFALRRRRLRSAERLDLMDTRSPQMAQQAAGGHSRNVSELEGPVGSGMGMRQDAAWPVEADLRAGMRVELQGS